MGNKSCLVIFEPHNQFFYIGIPLAGQGAREGSATYNEYRVKLTTKIASLDERPRQSQHITAFDLPVQSTGRAFSKQSLSFFILVVEIPKPNYFNKIKICNHSIG